jgi:peptidoglycan hydrolase-like protein with peptidoglycan-binding domain
VPVRFRSFLSLLAVLIALPLAALAQSSYWVQVEAHATLRTAEDFAARYDARIGSVAGFRIAGGWYALALGPYETAADAEAVRTRLIAAREIRGDAYVTDSTIYGQQFWPAGAAARETGQPPQPQPEPPAAAVPQPEPAPAPQIVLAPTPEPAPQVVAAPEPAPETEETLAQARALDQRLTRDERVEIQTALQFFGFYTQRIDGAFGPGTRNAIQNWQRASGFEPTGFLTTRQRAALLGAREAELARFDFRTVRDDAAGVEITLPVAMVEFDRHEAPFAHFREINGSGMRVLLISQEGSQSTLFGLYEIMQTLTVIPTEGPRERRANGFILTGRNDTARAHAEARIERGQIKGWVLLWEPRADDDARQVLSTMQASFRAIGGVLPDGAGNAGSSVSRRDLVAGLEVRRPIRARSGFFVDAVGTVVTAAEAVAGCDRVTIDEAYTAQVRLVDAALGVAVLSPSEPLVPLAFAQFAPQAPRPDTEVRLSGYAFQDTLSRPLLTFGRLADLRGINGETEVRLLTLAAQEGDAGGPVFDGNGAVIGMLLPRPQMQGRMLPPDVNYALGSEAILAALERARLRGALSRDTAIMSPEVLTRVSGDLTVLVSCWN